MTSRKVVNLAIAVFCVYYSCSAWYIYIILYRYNFPETTVLAALNLANECLHAKLTRR